MGYNSVVLVLNDALDQIKNDKGFGENLTKAILKTGSYNTPTDIDAGTSFDATNNSASTTVPGTAGYIDQISVTLTNNDSIAAGDLARVAIARKAADAGDTATGDLYLIQIELRDNGA